MQATVAAERAGLADNEAGLLPRQCRWRALETDNVRQALPGPTRCAGRAGAFLDEALKTARVAANKARD